MTTSKHKSTDNAAIFEAYANQQQLDEGLKDQLTYGLAKAAGGGKSPVTNAIDNTFGTNLKGRGQGFTARHQKARDMQQAYAADMGPSAKNTPLDGGQFMSWLDNNLKTTFPDQNVDLKKLPIYNQLPKAGEQVDYKRANEIFSQIQPELARSMGGAISGGYNTSTQAGNSGDTSTDSTETVDNTATDTTGQQATDTVDTTDTTDVTGGGSTNSTTNASSTTGGSEDLQSWFNRQQDVNYITQLRDLAIQRLKQLGGNNGSL